MFRVWLKVLTFFKASNSKSLSSVNSKNQLCNELFMTFIRTKLPRQYSLPLSTNSCHPLYNYELNPPSRAIRSPEQTTFLGSKGIWSLALSYGDIKT